MDNSTGDRADGNPGQELDLVPGTELGTQQVEPVDEQRAGGGKSKKPCEECAALLRSGSYCLECWPGGHFFMLRDADGQKIRRGLEILLRRSQGMDRNLVNSLRRIHRQIGEQIVWAEQRSADREKELDGVPGHGDDDVGPGTMRDDRTYGSRASREAGDRVPHTSPVS